jgi:hypothetical protein
MSWASWRPVMAPDRSWHTLKSCGSGNVCASLSGRLSNSLLQVRPSGVLFMCHPSHFHAERIWALIFAVAETKNVGRTQCKWLLSLELGELSPVVHVDADLFIEGSTLDATGSGGFDGPLLAISFGSTVFSFGSTVSKLKPGRENAISVRLDDGPMGPHLFDEYVRVLASLCHRRSVDAQVLCLC